MLANAESPKKSGYKFVVDTSDESHPFDGYNAYFEFEFWISIQFQRVKNHYFGSHERESSIVIWNKLVSIFHFSRTDIMYDASDTCEKNHATIYHMTSKQ